MATKKTNTADVSDILKVESGVFRVCIVGESPLINNRLSNKAKRELLMPKGRKSSVERATSLKHLPVEEFRESPYTLEDPASPTFLALPATAFKGAIRNAAIDMPNAKKAQIGRLIYVASEYIGIYGIPKVFMRAVRSADMNKTPDIRTRAIVARWACEISIIYVMPLIRPQAVANLLASAGISQGVGDWRPEKGSGSYGRFRVTDDTDPEYLEIVAAGGRQAQIDALASPTCYDNETAELFAWFDEEHAIRKMRGVA